MDINDLVFEFMNRNYDYCWLKAMHHKAIEESVESIVVGSSHGLFGIDQTCFKKGCSNLSMHSQDLYYNFLNMKYCIENNSHQIKRCFIIMGYYVVYQDLSLSVNEREWLIKRVYDPLFHDKHNWKSEEEVNLWAELLGDMDKTIADQVTPICEQVIDTYIRKHKNYYDQMRLRKPVFDFGGRVWPQLSKQEQLEFGKKRAEQHNHLLKYRDSFVENRKILLDMITYLTKKGIEPIIVVTPYTKEYRENIAGEFKEKMLEVLNEAKEPVHFVEMNEFAEGMFEEDDFVDTDHLSEKGAQKVSEILSNMFE